MSNVYKEKPNIVEVKITDDTGGEAVYYFTRRTIEEVVADIIPGEEGSAIAAPKKERKPRRTKAEIAAAKPAEVMPAKDNTWP